MVRHRLDKATTASSILALRTLHTWRNRQTRCVQTAEGNRAGSTPAVCTIDAVLAKRQTRSPEKAVRKLMWVRLPRTAPALAW